MKICCKFAQNGVLKENASQKSADFEVITFEVKNKLNLKHTIWPDFEEKMKVEKSWILLIKYIITT